MFFTWPSSHFLAQAELVRLQSGLPAPSQVYILVPSNDSDILVYPYADNIIYGAYLRKTSSVRLFGWIVARADIYRDRVFEVPSRKCTTPHPGPSRAHFSAATTDVAMSILCPYFSVRLGQQKGDGMEFFIRMSRLNDIQLLVLANLLHSDYCIIPSLGPVTALECFDMFFQRFGGDLANVSDLKELGTIFPTSWSEPRVATAVAKLCTGLASFLFQPVRLRTPTHLVPFTWVILQCKGADSIVSPPWLMDFVRANLPWLSSLTLKPVITDVSQYVHLDETGCAPMAALAVVLVPRVVTCIPSTIRPWTTGAVPRLDMETIVQYLHRSGAARTRDYALDLIVSAVRRLDCPQDKQLVPTIGQSALDATVLVISANVPLSLDKPGSAKTIIALKCATATSGADAADGHALHVSEIDSAQCSCTIRTTESCCHIVALLNLLFFNRNNLGATVTAVASTWRAPSGGDKRKHASDVSPVEDLRVHIISVEDILADDVHDRLDARAAQHEAKAAAQEAKFKERLSVLRSPTPSFVTTLMRTMDDSIFAARQSKKEKKMKKTTDNK